MSIVACTIISNNYLAFARVLARSLAEHHPEIPLIALFVDEPSPPIDYDAQPFRCLFPSDLEIGGFPNLAFRYSIIELNTAVKPFLLERILEEGRASKVVYFDPDILVTGSLDPVWSALDRASLVLTPHVLSSLPDDELVPNERTFLRAGIYNLGFAGFSDRPDVRSFLCWWQERLRRYCYNAPEQHLFVDQKWMDFAPAYVDDAVILRDPGLNVAYWNLSHRELQRSGTGWTVGSRPLRFFHFSGFNPRDPTAISKYQNRHRLSDRPDLQPIFQEYTERLDREGRSLWQDIPYSFGFFDDGMAIPAFARESYSQEDPRGDRWLDPFSTASGGFRDWLEEIVDEKTRRPRFVEEIHRSREDLRQAFPHVPGESEPGYSKWLVEGCPDQYDFPTEWLELLQAYRSSVDSHMAFIPGFLRELHATRSDLQEAFPAIDDKDRNPFFYWWISEGSLEDPVPRNILRSVEALLPLRSRIGSRLRRLLGSGSKPQG